MNIALISPSRQAYSETFIKVHKEEIKGNVFYFFGGVLPSQLEGKGNLLTFFSKTKYYIKRLINSCKIPYRVQVLLDAFKEHKIDVVLAEYGPTGEAVAPICEALKIPLLVHFHGYDASVKTVIEKNKFYKNTFRVAKFVIVVSKEMLNDLIAMGCPKEKLIYNPCAPQDIFSTVAPKFSKPQFLAVGRFTEKKGPMYSIKAFKKVVEHHSEAELMMAGTGELLESCKTLVRDLDLQHRVRFLDIVTHQELLDYMKDALAFLQHSVTAQSGDKEGTPVAVLEASLAGLPVISTYHAGIPDVIVHEKTGLLVKEGDVDAMSKYMFKLLENPDFAKTLGQNGRKRIQEHFTLEKHIATLNTILKQAVDG